jgi:cell division protein FtsB
MLLLGTVLLITFSPRGLLHLRDLHQEYQRLIHRNQSIEQENRRLYQEITRLNSDLASVEHLARQELGLVREDEIIIYFAPPEGTKDSHSR